MGRVSVRWQAPEWLRRPAEAVGLGAIYLRVTELALEGPRFDDRMVEHVVKLRSLESITLANTKLSQVGVNRLRRALPDCRIDWRN
jgi:hypothetical protein